MKIVKVHITIKNIEAAKITGFASNTRQSAVFEWFPQSNTLEFKTKNLLSKTIEQFRFQFTKVLRSALNGKIQHRNTIHCVFIEGFVFLDETQYNHYIQLDRRHGQLKISSSPHETPQLPKLYTDGSYAALTQNSGFGAIIEHPEGNKEIFSQSFPEGGSNLMELLAVLEGLKRLQQEAKIQILTDSRFVIRGMVQWIHFWKHNNWQTAHGKTVCFVKEWQEMDALSEGKYLEFKWIKGHSGHSKQDFCHKLARKSAKIE